jgi:hypothetical protein
MNDSHLIFRGSARFREDYEVQDRKTGRRLGYVRHGGRHWVAVPDDDRPGGSGRTRAEAACAVWGSAA